MKGAKDDLVYKRPEIDNGVVNFVTNFFANLQSFNQIWFLVSTVRRNLKIFCRFIMFARALRHWTPTLSSPKRILEATENI